MDPAKYEYQSEFARRYVSQGRAEGRIEGKIEGCAEGEQTGRAALVIRLLSRRFGALPSDVQGRIETLSIAELDAIGERLLSASTLQEALGSV